MIKRQQSRGKSQQDEPIAKSIFPTFDVNVPMPRRTAVPPQAKVPSKSRPDTAPAAEKPATSPKSLQDD